MKCARCLREIPYERYTLPIDISPYWYDEDLCEGCVVEEIENWVNRGPLWEVVEKLGGDADDI